MTAYERRKTGGEKKVSNVWGDNHTALSWVFLFFIPDLNICLVVTGDEHSCPVCYHPLVSWMLARQGEEKVNFSFSGA